MKSLTIPSSSMPTLARLMLEVSDLEVHINGASKLRHVSFTVQEGEAVVVLGPNGAGKSTLMRALAGQLPIAGGQVLFMGQPLKGRASRRPKRGVVLAPQNHPVFPSLTVAEHLALVRSTEDQRERVLGLFPELKDHLKRRASNLSGGQRQMLSMSQSLLLQPRLLLLDEPSSGLAPKVVAAMFDAIATVVASGTSILLVEQNAARALRVTNRAVLLEHGSVALAGASQELLTNPHVKTVYLGL